MADERQKEAGGPKLGFDAAWNYLASDHLDGREHLTRSNSRSFPLRGARYNVDLPNAGGCDSS